MDDAEKSLSGSAFQMMEAVTGNARLSVTPKQKKLKPTFKYETFFPEFIDNAQQKPPICVHCCRRLLTERVRQPRCCTLAKSFTSPDQTVRHCFEPHCRIFLLKTGFKEATRPLSESPACLSYKLLPGGLGGGGGL